MLRFDDLLERDFDTMTSSKEFGVRCLNLRTNKSFSIIITDVFIDISDEGMPITKDNPIINLPIKNQIKQEDKLRITRKGNDFNFIVYQVQKDGIDGQDVYLKNA